MGKQVAYNSVLTERDREMMERISAHVKFVLKMEGKKISHLHAIAGMSPNTAYSFANGTTNYSILTLLRAFDALGYEVVPVKRTDMKRISEDPAAAQRVQKLKKYNKDAKRKERGQPLEDGTKTRVKRIKTSEGYLAAHSRKQQIESAASEDDFLADE